jgi:hypothetical protein
VVPGLLRNLDLMSSAENRMYQIALLLLFVVFSTQASAGTCPDRYRFVDFGLEGRDGVIRRGGTILRAFDESNTHLLLPEATICLSVERLATDGRALPVPVVSGIAFDLEVVEIGLATLKVAVVEDVEQVAAKNAEQHLLRLTQDGVRTTRGADFICASGHSYDDVSCQVVSPYGGEAALVVYCDVKTCEMPVLGVDEQLVATAVWPRGADTADAVGDEASRTVQRIFSFLETRF